MLEDLKTIVEDILCTRTGSAQDWYPVRTLHLTYNRDSATAFVRIRHQERTEKPLCWRWKVGETRDSCYHTICIASA